MVDTMTIDTKLTQVNQNLAAELGIRDMFELCIFKVPMGYSCLGSPFLNS